MDQDQLDDLLLQDEILDRYNHDELVDHLNLVLHNHLAIVVIALRAKLRCETTSHGSKLSLAYYTASAVHKKLLFIYRSFFMNSFIDINVFIIYNIILI